MYYCIIVHYFPPVSYLAGAVHGPYDQTSLRHRCRVCSDPQPAHGHRQRFAGTQEGGQYRRLNDLGTSIAIFVWDKFPLARKKFAKKYVYSKVWIEPGTCSKQDIMIQRNLEKLVSFFANVNINPLVDN